MVAMPMDGPFDKNCITIGQEQGKFTWTKVACSAPQHYVCSKQAPQKYNYRVSNSAVPWHEAKKICRDWDGELTSIADELENKLILDLARDEGNFWIGLFLDASTAKKQWADKAPLTEFQPLTVSQTPGDKCGVLSSSSKDWKGIDCTESNRFVCKKVPTLLFDNCTSTEVIIATTKHSEEYKINATVEQHEKEPFIPKKNIITPVVLESAQKEKKAQPAVSVGIWLGIVVIIALIAVFFVLCTKGYMGECSVFFRKYCCARKEFISDQDKLMPK